VLNCKEGCVQGALGKGLAWVRVQGCKGSECWKVEFREKGVAWVRAMRGVRVRVGVSVGASVSVEE